MAVTLAFNSSLRKKCKQVRQFHWVQNLLALQLIHNLSRQHLQHATKRKPRRAERSGSGPRTGGITRKVEVGATDAKAIRCALMGKPCSIAGLVDIRYHKITRI